MTITWIVVLRIFLGAENYAAFYLAAAERCGSYGRLVLPVPPLAKR